MATNDDVNDKVIDDVNDNMYVYIWCFNIISNDNSVVDSIGKKNK